jgi:hypothetical protein
MNHAYKVFLATPKDADEHFVSSVATEALEKFKTALEHGDVEIVTASDDYRDNFGRCGGWDSWCRDVAQGVDYVYRTPRYNAILCTQMHVGKATASIARLALEAGRMVLVRTPDCSYKRVSAVVENDPNDYKAGWGLRIDN